MNSCRLCENKKIKTIFDLGILPMGYPISEYHNTAKKVWKKKLELAICNKCFLVQTVDEVSPKKIISEIHYQNLSKIVSNHHHRIASSISTLFSSKKDPLIVEIGCGNGSFLNTVRSHGFKNTIGIEPSMHKNVKYKFEVINDFFNSKVVKKLEKEKKNPDIIIANHLVETIFNLKEFFQNLANVMKDGSYTIIEVPYLIDFIKDFRIDVFSHIDCNWFSINSLIFGFERYGLEIIDIKHDKSYRGGTLTVLAQKNRISKNNFNPRILSLMKNEKRNMQLDNFEEFKNKIKVQRKQILQHITDLMNQMPIYGYGGGIKASTLLNWLRLSSNDIKMIVDTDYNKHFKVIPVANIPIRPMRDLTKITKRIAIIILALDYTKEIIPVLKEILLKDSLIIIPIPRFKIIKVDKK